MNVKLLDKMINIVNDRKWIADLKVVDKNNKYVSKSEELTTAEFVHNGYTLRIYTIEGGKTYVNYLSPKQVKENMEFAKPFVESNMEKCAMVFVFGEVAV